MNIEEIRRNKPDGATHYRIVRNGREVQYFMKPPYGLPLVYYYGNWEDCEEWSGEYNRFIKPL